MERWRSDPVSNTGSPSAQPGKQRRVEGRVSLLPRPLRGRLSSACEVALMPCPTFWRRLHRRCSSCQWRCHLAFYKCYRSLPFVVSFRLYKCYRSRPGLGNIVTERAAAYLVIYRNPAGGYIHQGSVSSMGMIRGFRKHSGS